MSKSTPPSSFSEAKDSPPSYENATTAIPITSRLAQARRKRLQDFVSKRIVPCIEARTQAGCSQTAMVLLPLPQLDLDHRDYDPADHDPATGIHPLRRVKITSPEAMRSEYGQTSAVFLTDSESAFFKEKGVQAELQRLVCEALGLDLDSVAPCYGVPSAAAAAAPAPLEPPASPPAKSRQRRQSWLNNMLGKGRQRRRETEQPARWSKSSAYTPGLGWREDVDTNKPISNDTSGVWILIELVQADVSGEREGLSFGTCVARGLGIKVCI